MLAKKPLTAKGIEALKPPPEGKRRLVWDALVPGLAVRVTDKDTKAFVLVTRVTQLPDRLASVTG
jgi:hypothetical protein